MAFPARGEKGRLREVVALRDVFEINAYPFQWRFPLTASPATGSGTMALRISRNGRPVLLDPRGTDPRDFLQRLQRGHALLDHRRELLVREERVSR